MIAGQGSGGDFRSCGMGPIVWAKEWGWASKFSTGSPGPLSTSTVVCGDCSGSNFDSSPMSCALISSVLAFSRSSCDAESGLSLAVSGASSRRPMHEPSGSGARVAFPRGIQARGDREQVLGIELSDGLIQR